LVVTLHNTATLDALKRLLPEDLTSWTARAGLLKDVRALIAVAEAAQELNQALNAVLDAYPYFDYASAPARRRATDALLRHAQAHATLHNNEVVRSK
jgi:hypothetical protein